MTIHDQTLRPLPRHGCGGIIRTEHCPAWLLLVPILQLAEWQRVVTEGE
jgi:hypothetical protein